MTTAPTLPTDDTCWEAVLCRDRSADGRFWFAVRTTGILCRPSCPAPRPKRENVRFYSAPQAALSEGYRPCKRCHPLGIGRDAEQAALVAHLCTVIAEAEQVPSLDELAALAKLSPSHLRRLFLGIAGLTPKEYAVALRRERTQQSLQQSATVTEALYAGGFQSSGRFYEAAPGLLGMPPGAYQRGGEGQIIRFAIAACSLGIILVASTEQGICAILMGDAPEPLVRNLHDRFSKARIEKADEAYAETVATVVAYVEAPRLGWALPLDLQGTLFQQRVWQALREIPCGETVSYTTIARKMGLPKAMRAVAQACGANPVAVVVPCHRVVRSDGGISGYRWGVERKRELLRREGIDRH